MARKLARDLHVWLRSQVGHGNRTGSVRYKVEKRMKTKCFAVIAALNLVVGSSALAQDGAGVNLRNEVEVDVPQIPDRPERPERGEKRERPERPERPDKGGLSQEMKDLVAEFRSKVTEFHSEQKELVKKLKNATEEERSEIREQIKTNREEFKNVKEEFRDSVKELTGTLKDHANKVSAEAKVQARSGRSRD